MRYLFLISIALILISCNEEKLPENGFKIEGKLNYLRDGYIKLSIRKGAGLLVLDSAKVEDDSTFVLEGILENPQYAQINFFDKQANIFPISEGNFRIVADGNTPEGYFKIEGSTEIEQHFAFIKLIEERQNKMVEIQQKMTYAMGNNNQEEAEILRKSLIQSLNEQNEFIKSYVDSLGTGNLVGGFALVNYLNPIEHFEFFDQKVKAIEAKENPTDFEIKFISEFNNKRADLVKAIEKERIKVEMEEKLAVGNKIPEISLPNPNGKTINLSDFRGQIVLVDFWAGWCRPCRMENPNLVAAYNTFHKSGFEIYGVSLDRTKEQWENAITQDGLKWPQVSDLGYWDSKVIKEFNITGIPANFLIDREGVIIAKDLRGPALQQKLEELFSKG